METTAPSDSTYPSNCVVCQIPAKAMCSGCKMVKYCGPEHQRSHWPGHKRECRPFRIAHDIELGRYLLATRDIKANSKIFVESPLIVGPKWYLTDHEKKVTVVPCVGCFTPCSITSHQCPRCKWPCCSPDCPGLENLNLHGCECSVLSLGSGPSSRKDTAALMDYYRPDALVVLKCLLLQRQNPKKWMNLIDMQSHEKERIGTELHADAEKRIVSFLQKNFLQRLKNVEQKSKETFLKAYDVNICHRICGIIETNYMCIQTPTGLELSGVYHTACMMEHACRPNCSFQFDHNNGFRVIVTAGRDIKSGEHLKISYSNMLWGTQMRQEHLTLTKHFLCKCERCADPTEFGTYFSALRCVGDVGMKCGGTQLPTDPLKGKKTDWLCDKCGIAVSGEEVQFLLSQITEEVEGLLARRPNIKEIELLIAKLSQLLHPNHYLLFNLKHSLIQLLCNETTQTSVSDALLTRKKGMCEELYEICGKLDPASIRLGIYVAIILNELHNVALRRGNGLMTSEGAEVDIKRAKTEYELAREYLTKAVKLLNQEGDNSVGKKLRNVVTKAVENLNVLIEGLYASKSF